jgi:hypothetical protein
MLRVCLLLIPCLYGSGCECQHLVNSPPFAQINTLTDDTVWQLVVSSRIKTCKSPVSLHVSSQIAVLVFANNEMTLIYRRDKFKRQSNEREHWKHENKIEQMICSFTVWPDDWMANFVSLSLELEANIFQRLIILSFLILAGNKWKKKSQRDRQTKLNF